MWIFFSTVPKPNSGHFLKVSCDMESKTILMNFTLCVFVLNPFITLQMDLLLMHWSFGKDWFTDLCIPSSCWLCYYIISKVHKHMKRCSTPLISREMQIKTTMRNHLTPVRMVITKKTRNNKLWWGCGQKGTLVHYWWDCTLVQLL